jgi:hypothetical protein
MDRTLFLVARDRDRVKRFDGSCKFAGGAIQLLEQPAAPSLPAADVIPGANG